ncbi:MAG: hypothetical protein IKB16_14165, partial [Lentisphaeria bacterium]|nr:hypothetical protein [Lentisphaeria bacterium]
VQALDHILYDSHRVDGVSVETDGIVVAMTFPETSLHWRICHSVPERHIRQCRSWSMSFDVFIPRVTLRFTLGCLTLAVLTGLVLQQTCVLSGY